MLLHVWAYNFEDDIFEQVTMIDNVTSVIWVTRYNQAGEFEIYMPATKELIDIFSRDGIVIARDDTARAMYVEKLKLTTSAEDGDYITVSGRSIECILERRIVPSQTIVQYPSFVTGLYYLVYNNMIEPSNQMRKIPFVFFEGNMPFWQESIDMQITGKDLLTCYQDICASYKTGFKMSFVTISGAKAMRISFYRGVDRTLGQSVNNRVIFSPEMENLGNTEYEVDRTQFCNWVYVAGEGEGNQRKIRQVAALTELGLGAVEKWLDARNTSSNDGEISDTDYKKMLTAEGQAEIEISSKIAAFSGEVLNYNSYTYGVDYNLGDIVSVINEYGIKGSATITEITEVEDETGYKLVPTLSEWAVTA